MGHPQVVAVVRGGCLLTLTLLVGALLGIFLFKEIDNPDARGFGGLLLEENVHCPVVKEPSIQPFINPFATSLGCPLMQCPHPPKPGECPNPPFTSVDYDESRVIVQPLSILSVPSGQSSMSIIIEVIEGVDFFVTLRPPSHRLDDENLLAKRCRYHLMYFPSNRSWSHPIIFADGPPAIDSSVFPPSVCQAKVKPHADGLAHSISYDEIFQVRTIELGTWKCLGSNLHAMNIVKQQTLKKAKHRVDEKKEISSPLSSPSLYGVAGKKNVNLLVLFIDNMSLQAFYDTMPLTIGWLKKRMAESSGEEPSSNPEKDIMVHQFLRYNSVGNRSNPNITPMFRGHSSDNTKFNRNRKYAWQRFRENGYVTLWSVEQCADYMSEYWKGNSTETDYEFQKVFCDPTYGKVALRNRCVQQDYAYKHLWNYLKHFIANHQAVPWMALSLFMENHDGFCLGRTGGIMDAELRGFFEWMYTKNYLNETVIMLLSDHGAQDHLSPHYHTLNGAVEFHNPTLVITTPKWMSDAFPREFKLFGENQQRLVTSYNIFHTMLHLLDFPLSLAQQLALTEEKKFGLGLGGEALLMEL